MGANTENNYKTLDGIVETLLQSVEISKKEIFTIAETSRHDYESVLKTLEKLKEEIRKLVDRNDELHIQIKKARIKLVQVSKDFGKNREQRLQEAYEYTNTLQIEYVQMYEREQQLKTQRDELERRLIQISAYIEKADSLGTQMLIISQYLSSDIVEMNEYFISAQEKQQLGLRLLEMQEEERKNISREIHDGPAQMLANVLIRTDLTERVYRERGGEAALHEIRSIRCMVRDALSEVRKIIYNLRPMALDDLGIVPTLRKYVETMENYTDCEIVLQYTGISLRLPPAYEVALFRIAQEGIQNALKHSKATIINVKLEILKDYVVLIIKDNGIGFDINEKKEGTFGLLGMRERLEILSGTLQCLSTINKGTTICVNIPLTNELDIDGK